MIGASYISGFFTSTDWESGMRMVQERDAALYGNSYSGTNGCRFEFGGVQSYLTGKQLDDLIYNRMGKELNKGHGIVVGLGLSHYEIRTPLIQEISLQPEDIRSNLCGLNAPAVLLDSAGNRVGRGTLASLKKKAFQLLISHKCNTRYTIVGKSHCFDCYYTSKEVESTKRRSTDTYVVVPIYKYVYMGWCLVLL